ncbi:hypothetical protein J2S20_002242 [Moryella indoligenes]|uniref:DUF4376 domain-containing protein n=1 Tax=Moryella indoligenes TaxID=371674 RepID=A0AAE4AMU9_9FIRM|nr:acyl carrier protein [Moryella indoligenes]MDQ0153521.1 hypothetical protein [Moryella indoligenes]
MEKIIIKNNDYNITDIRPSIHSVIQITFADEVPEEYGDIDVYTAGGVQSAHLPGFATVYRRDDKTVWLSNDGSVYTPPETSQATQEELYTPSLEEVQAMKLQEVNGACTELIQRGIDVGGEHYSLTEIDQLNLFGLRAQIISGAQTVPYHADGKLCRFYTIEEIAPVIEAAMKLVTYHTTYCNSMHAWIKDCEDVETVRAIQYGAPIPEQYQSDVLKGYLAGAAS